MGDHLGGNKAISKMMMLCPSIHTCSMYKYKYFGKQMRIANHYVLFDYFPYILNACSISQLIGGLLNMSRIWSTKE